eukprot:CAMPEP_0118642542 /NCGR_PEP_ID=MMETSP0785-20121206/5887_1 /TAXON_ID=91992 /ORGANISM="Bolidomonas pacifica, Strain CCMP 1866" /LENGTH=1549 /DNA_ID=CAMNT_0006534093 /DNA_START=130 /DNA_END=4776 /DNA_ORIENTATION=-
MPPANNPVTDAPPSPVNPATASPPSSTVVPSPATSGKPGLQIQIEDSNGVASQGAPSNNNVEEGEGENDESTQAPLPPKSPKRKALKKSIPSKSPVHHTTDPKAFTPSPGKRTDKIDVAAGLSASKGSKGSHKKNKSNIHHLQPPGQPRIDFKRLITEHGSFAGARKALRHRVEDYQHEIIKKRESEFTDSHLGDLFDETVRLSGVSGPPTLNTPFDKMKEVMKYNEKVKAGIVDEKSGLYEDVKFATRTGWRTGELLIPQKKLDSLPPYLGTTLQLQLAPPKKMSVARNQLSSFLTTYVPQISCRHLSYVVELDLGTNDIVRLPKDMGHLSSLVRLNLERNRLQELPESMLNLPKIKVLKLNKNNFKSIHRYIGKLVTLEHLDLSNNVLDILPATLPKLKHLKYLDVSGNGLAHLGIQPILQEWEDRLKQRKNKALLKAKSEQGVWMEVVDPHTGKTCYYNRLTETASNTKPIAVNSGKDGEDTVGTIPGHLDRLIPLDNFSHYMQRKKFLALNGTTEWSVDMDQSSGKIYYKNNVSGEVRWVLPESMDTIGGCVSMVHFKANQNLIRDFPSSICRMTKLEVLEAKNNYIGDLPEELGNLKKLKTMKLNQNEIKLMPNSMEFCTSLTELQLTGNYIDRFPDFINKLGKVKRIMLGNNFLKILPYTLGFLKGLVDLQLFNNPLIDPPYDVVMEGLEATLYFCRQKYWARINGPPPIVKVHASGIGDECLELQPEFRDRLDRMIRDSQESRSLELQLLNLQSIPEAVFNLEGLKNMDLSRNNFSLAPLEWCENFQTINSLYLKSCRMRELGPDVQLLRNLVEMNLEDNNLEFLPPQICRLRRLQFINFSKNRLYELPDDFGTMVDLKEVILDINRLEKFPKTIGNLRHLEILSCNRNWLYELDPGIVELSALQELCLDGNYITVLPEGIGKMNLNTLKLAHNRLEYLETDCLRPNLVNSLSVFWVSSNNLIELPQSFVDMKCLDDMKIEYNPMRSPPMELVQEGMQTVMQYCRIRASRVNELAELLEEVGFETDVTNYKPEAKNVLTGETGFLTPDDMREFDEAVDAFLNGKYYLYPAPAIEMRDKIDDLRYERETVFYHMILEALLRVIKDEIAVRSNPETAVLARFSENVLRDDLIRPWGRSREKVLCYGISTKALLQACPANYFVSEDRPSLYDVTKQSLPETIFEYSEDVLKDAMKNFQSPYGSVAAWDEKVPYDACECVDDSGVELKHLPCVIRSVVIVRTIYTAAESKRREEEETTLEGYFNKMETNIDKWLAKAQGLKSLTSEVLQRTKGFKAQLEISKKALSSLVTKDLENAKANLKNAQQRKKDFEDGKAKVFHKLEGPEDAVKVVQEAEAGLKEAESKIEEEKEKIKHLKKMSKMGRDNKEELAIKDLRKKYCFFLYKEQYRYGREMAKQRGWRRPWDGPDGKAFIEYQNEGRQEGMELKRLAGEGGALPGAETAAGKAIEEDSSDSDDDAHDELEAMKDANLAIDRLLNMQAFDWQDTQDMDQYNNDPYEKYANSFGHSIVNMASGIGKKFTRFMHTSM